MLSDLLHMIIFDLAILDAKPPDTSAHLTSIAPKDYYKILGVKHTATSDQIKQK